MSDGTGFHDVPWDLYTANGGDLDGLPPAGPRYAGACCNSEWVGPTDEAGETHWLCCLSEGHEGTHRGSDSVSTVAEWRDADSHLSLARVRYAEAVANGWTVVAMHDGSWSVEDVGRYISAAEAVTR